MSNMIPIPERGIYLASRSPRRRELLSQIGVRYHLLLFRERVGENPTSTRACSRARPRPPTSSAWRAPRPKPAGAACCSGTCRRRRCSPPTPRWRSTTASSASPRTAPGGGDPRRARRQAPRGAHRGGAQEPGLDRGRAFRFEVQLKSLSKDEIAHYVASGEGDDKAGAYGIQGRAARFVRDPRQLFRDHGAAAVRDRPADRPPAVSESP